MSRLTRGERRSLTRRGESAELLVVGLGNPGLEFANTRHNVGREVIDEVVKRHNSSLKTGKEQALVSEVRHEGKLIVFAIPMTFMNDSGIAVAKLMRRYGLSEVKKLLVVHDELDLEVGHIRLKEGGGLLIDSIGGLPIDEDIDLLPDVGGGASLAFRLIMQAISVTNSTSTQARAIVMGV